MRLSKPLVSATVALCLAYCAVLANAAPSRRALADGPSPLADLGRMLPRLSLPAQAVLTAREGLAELRQVVQSSALMRDTRQSDEAARRAHLALWAELETGLRPVSAATPSDPSGLLPGQD